MESNCMIVDGGPTLADPPYAGYIPRPSHLIGGLALEGKISKRFDCHRRKKEQACDPCRKKEVKCDGKEPSSASYDGHNIACSFTKRMKQQRRKERKGSLNRMAERIDRIECMLRQRGFLKDDQGKNDQKVEMTKEDLEEITEEISTDVISVPSLCETGLDSTFQTGFTATATTTMDPPPVSDKSRVMGHVEKWLEGVPPFVAGLIADDEKGSGMVVQEHTIGRLW